MSAAPANIAPQIPSIDRVVTITEAIITPRKIDKRAFDNRTLKRNAAIEPVHAPVIGRGMATNNIKPIDLYFSTIVLLLLVRLKSQSKNILKGFIRLKSLEKGPRNSRSGMTGIMFPRIAKGTTKNHSILNKFIPTGIPPLNSKTGRVEIIMTAIPG